MRNKYVGDDIRSRLSGTVIRYKRRPFFCEVDDSCLMLYSLVDHSLQARVQPDDEFIDISSLPLGYINIDHPDYKSAIYLMREPFRQYKQGVDLSRLAQFPLGTGVVHWKYLQSAGLVNCVLGEYPTYDEAVERITKEQYRSVAIDRDIALKREKDTLNVYLKNLEVGHIKLGSDTVVIHKNGMTSFAKDILEEIKGWKVIGGEE